MSLSGHNKATTIMGFPRVSGDEPLAVGQSFTVARFSPRERG